MRLLGEIDRDTGVDRSGRAVTREAVRAIIRRRGSLLMIYSPVNGDYKFPGGGVEAGESREEALEREVREECGTVVTGIDAEFGRMIEYAIAKEPEFDLFVMTSYYFCCTVDGSAVPVRLDPYEAELGFTPVWIGMGDAIAANERILAAGSHPRWTPRDTFVLKILRDERRC